MRPWDLFFRGWRATIYLVGEDCQQFYPGVRDATDSTSRQTFHCSGYLDMLQATAAILSLT